MSLRSHNRRGAARIKHGSGLISQEELAKIIAGRNQNYLLATRRIGRGPDGLMCKVVKASELGTSSWSANRFFPERELWRDFTGKFIVQDNKGIEIVELYKGSDETEALNAYNKE